MGNYKNFDLVVYFIAQGVVHARKEQLQKDIDFFKHHMQLEYLVKSMQFFLIHNLYPPL